MANDPYCCTPGSTGSTGWGSYRDSSRMSHARAGNEDLRREVESLLAQPAADGVLDRPAWEPEAGGGLPPEATRLTAGQRISHYEIQEKLGEGGMGAVYRAYDTQLRRPVALKVVPPEYTSDPGRPSRLLRGARAASALITRTLSTFTRSVPTTVWTSSRGERRRVAGWARDSSLGISPH
jgi:hypothetical protein